MSLQTLVPGVNDILEKMKSVPCVMECELIEDLSVKININRFFSKRILRKKVMEVNFL